MVSLDPRATLEIPHPALGAHVGGPVPTKAKTPVEGSARAEQGYQLLTPRFEGTVLLTPTQSAAFSAGQIGTVQFRATTETLGARLLKSFDQWMRRQLTAHERA